MVPDRSSYFLVPRRAVERRAAELTRLADELREGVEGVKASGDLLVTLANRPPEQREALPRKSLRERDF